MSKPFSLHPRLRKNPMVSRSFLAASLVAVSAPAAAETVTEKDVIRLVGQQAPEVIAARQQVAVAEAARLEASLRENPSLGWDREAVSAETEDALVIGVPIDLSSRRSIRDKLGQADVAVARSEVARARSAAVVRALSVFYQLLGERERARIEQRAVDRLAEAARIVSRRKSEGTASGFDQVRVEIEAELATSRLRQTRARAGRLRAELALLCGLDPASLEVSGELASPSRSPETGASRSLRLLREAQRHAADAAGASTWSWVPTLSIGGGPRIVRTDETRAGYVVGLSIELPIFSRGQALRARAAARRRLAGARAAAAERSTRIGVAAATRALSDATQEAARFERATGDRLERLERAAASGYREGRLSIVELLDARRAETAVAERRLELALASKRAELALRAAQGELE